MTHQEIQDMYDENPDLTIPDVARKAGLDIEAVKRILLTDLGAAVYQQE